MENNQLAAEIYKSAYITGEFLLRSGQTSNEYFDKYLFESSPYLLNQITNKMLELIDDDFDILGALEMGGIPIATLLSVKLDKPILFIRKKAKEYGTCKFAEGVDYKGMKILMVEDVVTSGGQIIISTDDIRKSGGIVQKAVCVIDRQSGGREKLSEHGIELYPLFTMEYIKASAKEYGYIK